MSYTLVPSELIVDGAITSAKLDTNIAISGTLGVTGEVTLATHLVMGDNDKIKIGTGGDLEIYHDGSNSYIANSTGNIYIADTNGAVHIQAKLNEESIVATADGAVTLYHDNSAKLATASGGVTVTGTLTATTLAGTLSTAAQTNITSVGTLTSFRSTGIDDNADALAITIDSSENVAIGVTSAYTGGKLSLNGGLVQPSGNQHVLGVFGTSGLQLIGTTGGDNIVGTMGSSEPLIFRTVSAERMRIDANGSTTFTKTGTNASPHIKLVESGDTREFNIYNDGSGNGHLVLADSDDDTPDTEIVLNDNGIITMLTGNSERMRIDANGNLGLGDSSPANFSGYVVASLADSTGAILDFKTTGSEGVFARIQGAVNNGLFITNEQAYPIAFNTNATERMRIDGSGNLLINQTSSNLTYGKLQVSEGSASAGHGGIVGFFDTDVSVGSSNVIQVLWFSGDNDATGGVFTRFRDGNSIMGQIEAANGTQVSYGVSSDERLKKNIVDASSQLNTIKNIKVREFEWKVNGYHEVGMIAQELHTVIPSAVQEGGDDLSEEPWGVDYSKLTPYLIKAVQEQQEQIDALQSEINILKGE